jgi:hypothetical protein
MMVSAVEGAIEAGEFESVGGRVDDANVHAAGFVLERTALRAGNAHHVAKCGEDDIGFVRDGEAIVNSPHGKNADGAAGAVDQFDVFRKDIFQAEAVDGVGMSAADLHHAVVAFGAGEAANFVGRF